MATLAREFEKVTEISSPGTYIFAGDMENRATQDPLPNSGGLSTDNIFGIERPYLETTLLSALEKTHPEILKIEYYRSGGVYRASEVKWFQRSGILKLGDQYYRFFRDINGDPKEGREVKIRLIDTPKLNYTSEDGVSSYYPPTEDDYNSELRIGFNEPSRKDIDARGRYWRGRIDLKGDKPGDLIATSLRFINQEIDRLQIPTWREIQQVETRP